ncbi:MAG: ABC transporter ATP-binding protein [Planctomycetota bacterium]
MGNEKSLIHAKDVHKSYRMGVTRLNVLKGVELSVGKGEFVAIIGASGSGKSTLLHTLGALDSPDKGKIEFEGRDISSLSAAGVSRFRNEMVGFVFQFYHLLDELNVLENVMLPAMVRTGVVGWLKTRKTAARRASWILERFGLAERLGHMPYQLSGGERQRVAMARALINEPRLVLADEPTGNLDSVTGNGILDMLEELNRSGQTIVIVTHDERIAARAKKVFNLADGKISQERPGKVFNAEIANGTENMAQ